MDKKQNIVNTTSTESCAKHSCEKCEIFIPQGRLMFLIKRKKNSKNKMDIGKLQANAIIKQKSTEKTADFQQF